jgi:IS5 family transposase
MGFAQFVVEGVCPENRFLEEMNKVVPWELLEKELKRGIIRKSGGRPAYPLLLLFKMHLLQVWFGLSDVGCEFQVRDRLSFRRFLGLEIDGSVPEATTLENFRHDFAPISAKVLSRLDNFFKEQGLLLKSGNVVDATFIRANSRPHKDPEKNSDSDARYGHKGFGYSATANVDVATKLIRKVHTKSANFHDSQLLSEALKGDETILYGDSAYQYKAKFLAQKQCEARMIQGKPRGRELGVYAQYLNRLYSKTRARVEHIFAYWKIVFKAKRAWYRGLDGVEQQIQSLALAYNLKRYGFLVRPA